MGDFASFGAGRLKVAIDSELVAPRWRPGRDGSTTVRNQQQYKLIPEADSEAPNAVTPTVTVPS